MKQILVYHRLNDDTYYYKIVKFSFTRHKLNSINSYNHKLILIIDDFSFKEKRSIKKVLINRLIRFLDKYNN